MKGYRCFAPAALAVLLGLAGPASAEPAQGAAAVATAPADDAEAALAARIGACWRPLVGAEDAASLVVELEVELTPSTEVARMRVVRRPPASAGRFGAVAVDRAMRAVRACSPLNQAGEFTLPRDAYPEWRVVRLRFDPRHVAG